MSHHIIEAKDLHYTYPDGTEAIKGISFRITHGESVAIIGENGAGKSTLLLHLNGYLLSTEGSLRVGDFSVTKQTLSEVRRTVGMVFEDPDDQLFMSTVFDDVAFGPLNLGLPSGEVEKRVTQALETVNMLHAKDRPPYKLSAGEKKSVAIATILSMSPNILVMDEPSSNLDPKGRRRLIELLKTFGHTKIVATHDLDLVVDLCERTIVIHEGVVAADGSTMELLRNDKLLTRCSLEKPPRIQGCPICGKEVMPSEPTQSCT